jgi:hypothetical protein
MATLHCKLQLELPVIPLQRHVILASYLLKLNHRQIYVRPFINSSSTDLPPVKPSAIALGIVFNQAASLAVLAPLFGDTYQRAKAADSSEEFFKSREAATAAASWGSSLVGSGIQTYGVAALINATGTLSYKGAAYLGSLIFMASAAPGVCSRPGIEYNIILTFFRSLPVSLRRSDLSTPLQLVF